MRVARLVAVATGLFLAGIALPGHAQSIRQPSSGALSYEAFMRLEQPQRALAYSELSIDDKDAIIRQHIGVWVKEHRESLSDEQVTHLERMADLLAPGTDREQTGEQFQEAFRTLECSLWRSDLFEAVAPHRINAHDGFFSDVMFWFHQCVTHREHR